MNYVHVHMCDICERQHVHKYMRQCRRHVNLPLLVNTSMPISSEERSEVEVDTTSSACHAAGSSASTANEKGAHHRPTLLPTPCQLGPKSSECQCEEEQIEERQEISEIKRRALPRPRNGSLADEENGKLHLAGRRPRKKAGGALWCLDGYPTQSCHGLRDCSDADDRG